MPSARTSGRSGGRCWRPGARAWRRGWPRGWRAGVGLREAGGRVLAGEVPAAMDVPPFPRAAMDGYAVKAQDTFEAGNFSPAILDLIGVVHAGATAGLEVRRG